MRRVIIGLVSCLLVMTGGTAAAAPPEVLVFTGICDASAVVALDEARIIVGDDEQPWLSVYGLSGGDSEARIPLPRAAAPADADAPEADLEGAAVFNGRIVWISSNGRNKNGKLRPERFQLFASHRLSSDRQQWLEDFSPSCGGLPEAIAATAGPEYEPLRQSIGDLHHTDKDLAPKKRGFNVEGLSVSDDGRFLLSGCAIRSLAAGRSCSAWTMPRSF